MRILVLTLMMSFVSQGAFASFSFVKLKGFADPKEYRQAQEEGTTFENLKEIKVIHYSIFPECDSEVTFRLGEDVSVRVDITDCYHNPFMANPIAKERCLFLNRYHMNGGVLIIDQTSPKGKDWPNAESMLSSRVKSWFKYTQRTGSYDIFSNSDKTVAVYERLNDEAQIIVMICGPYSTVEIDLRGGRHQVGDPAAVAESQKCFRKFLRERITVNEESLVKNGLENLIPACWSKDEHMRLARYNWYIRRVVRTLINASYVDAQGTSFPQDLWLRILEYIAIDDFGPSPS